MARSHLASRRVELKFRDWAKLPGVERPLRHDISAIAAIADSIFVACDESASVELLSATADGGFAEHRHFALGKIFELPGGEFGEMDIEGLDIEGGYLWITGSHSLKRDRPRRGRHGAGKALKRMLEIDREPNRYFVGCVPINAAKNGTISLVKADGTRTAASLPLHEDKSALLKWLGKDAHLRPFLHIPSKENGFDIEGMAVRGSRVWFGLRGPVLRGHAVILEFDFKRPSPQVLKARKIENGRRYRKHLIDSAGLGIRDMTFDGGDLLILTGTPLASDGPSFLLRWHNALYDTSSGVVDPGRIEQVLEMPYKGSIDHPEGITLRAGALRAHGPRELLVVHDSPGPDRIFANPARLIADAIALPDPGKA